MGDTPPTRGVGVWPHGKTTPNTHVVESRHRLRVERVARSSAEVNEYKQQTMADERGDASSSRSSEDRPRPQVHPLTTAAPSVESINHLARALTGPLEGALSASMEGFWERLDARLASLTPGPGLRGGRSQRTPSSNGSRKHQVNPADSRTHWRSTAADGDRRGSGRGIR